MNKGMRSQIRKLQESRKSKKEGKDLFCKANNQSRKDFMIASLLSSLDSDLCGFKDQILASETLPSYPMLLMPILDYCAQR